MRKLLLICISVISLLACKNEGKKKAGSEVVNNPVTAENPDADLSANAPILSFEENVHDFGKLIDGEVVTYKFKFKNTGNADLIISNASASCGCTIPNYPKAPIAPGEEGAIDVQFNSSGKVGVFDKNVTITANTVPTDVFLVIKGEVTSKK